MLMDLLAGLVCGLIMGTVFLGVAVYLLWSKEDLYDRLKERLPEAFPPGFVMLAAVIGVPPGCGLLGGLAGVLYHVAEDTTPDGGLGSPNLVFTIAVLGIAVLIGLIVFLLRTRSARIAAVVLTAFAAIFGWALPYLANWR